MPQATANYTGKAPPATACGDVPDFTRLNYFHGRALGALDLRREQSYFVEKARHANRLLHGWGIVCGLDVEVVAKPPCDPAEDAPDTAVLVVAPGAAIDCAGNDIVVRNPREVVLNALLGEDELREVGDAHGSVYLTLCYHEQPLDPMRPLLAAQCEPVADCQYGRVCETYRICASTTRPDPGPECEPCCGCCGERCIELAEIVEYDPKAPVRGDQLRFEGRRALAVHELTTIRGVNWVHGATYARDAASRLFDSGIKVHFSRPVQVDSLRRMAVELTAIEGGGGRSAGVYELEGEFVGLPDATYTDSFVYRSTTDETLQYGDRVVITVRGDFIVDACCRAVDASHVGGTVPTIEEDDATPGPLSRPGSACPPRPTGNGTEGGDFVSWIFVQDRSVST